VADVDTIIHLGYSDITVYSVEEGGSEIFKKQGGFLKYIILKRKFGYWPSFLSQLNFTYICAVNYTELYEFPLITIKMQKRHWREKRNSDKLGCLGWSASTIYFYMGHYKARRLVSWII